MLPWQEPLDKIPLFLTQSNYAHSESPQSKRTGNIVSQTLMGCALSKKGDTDEKTISLADIRAEVFSTDPDSTELRIALALQGQQTGHGEGGTFDRSDYLAAYATVFQINKEGVGNPEDSGGRVFASVNGDKRTLFKKDGIYKLELVKQGGTDIKTFTNGISKDENGNDVRTTVNADGSIVQKTTNKDEADNTIVTTTTTQPDGTYTVTVDNRTEQGADTISYDPYGNVLSTRSNQQQPTATNNTSGNPAKRDPPDGNLFSLNDP